ncbi:MAG: hypothetical protein ABI555_06445 [Chloroflexota bacterium]
MAEIHGLAAQITLVLVVLIAGWAMILAATRRAIPSVLAGGLVWVVLLLAATGLVGTTIALTTKPPKDPLHIVYGLLALAVLPGALTIARSRPDPRRSVLVLATASVVLLILVFRLFQTGG